MATAEEIITDALGEILVQASEQSVEPEAMQTSIRYLNRMMSEWAARGMSLGFTIITNPADSVTVPDGALNAVVYNLAIKLSQQYDAPITVNLASSAKDGMSAVLDLSVTSGATQMPSTMPLGSGNEGFLNNGSRHFYVKSDLEAAETEANRVINLESDT